MINNNNILKTRRKLVDYFIQNKAEIDHRDIEVLSKFLSSEGKILPSRRTGLTSANQRKLTKAIKRARLINFLPFANAEF